MMLLRCWNGRVELLLRFWGQLEFGYDFTSRRYRGLMNSLLLWALIIALKEFFYVFLKAKGPGWLTFLRYNSSE